ARARKASGAESGLPLPIEVRGLEGRLVAEDRTHRRQDRRDLVWMQYARRSHGFDFVFRATVVREVQLAGSRIEEDDRLFARCELAEAQRLARRHPAQGGPTTTHDPERGRDPDPEPRVAPGPGAHQDSGDRARR